MFLTNLQVKQFASVLQILMDKTVLILAIPDVHQSGVIMVVDVLMHMVWLIVHVHTTFVGVVVNYEAARTIMSTCIDIQALVNKNQDFFFMNTKG